MSDSQAFLRGIIAEDARVRPATEAERRFLRRYNRVRVGRLLFFWFEIVLVVGPIAGAHFLFMIVPGPYGTAALALLLLLLDLVILKVWGRALLRTLRTRPTLRVPDNVEVVEFRGPLYCKSHATDEHENIFMAGRNPVDLPGHWEPFVARWVRPRIAVAVLPGAANEVIRLRMFSSPENYGPRRRIDAVFTDFGNIVVGIDAMSVEREAQAGLPTLRANPVLLHLGFALALIAAGLGLCLWIMHDSRAEDRAQLEGDIRELEAGYAGGDPVDVEGLRMRGLEGLHIVPEFDGKVVRGDAFDAATVALGHDGPRFLLFPEERRLVAKLAQVFPEVIPGYSGPVSTEAVEGFRLRLVAALGDGTGPARERIEAVLRAMPDEMIEDQMRSQGQISRPTRGFVEALLPEPMIHRESGSTFVPQSISVICRHDAVLCKQSDGVKHYPDPVFVSQDGQLRLASAYGLETLRDKTAALDKAMAKRTTPWLDASCAALAGLAVLLGLFFFAARGRVRRFYGSRDG